MSGADVLNVAMQKAEAKGWKNECEFTAVDVAGTVMLMSSLRPSHYMDTPNEVLFDPEFAEALWGELGDGNFINPSYLISKDGNSEHIHTDEYHGPWWKYHLMQLAIAEDRLKYLEANI